VAALSNSNYKKLPTSSIQMAELLNSFRLLVLALVLLIVWFAIVSEKNSPAQILRAASNSLFALTYSGRWPTKEHVLISRPGCDYV
jgi:hypothetical protein